MPATGPAHPESTFPRGNKKDVWGSSNYPAAACKTFIAPEALLQFSMDNLKYRRILVAIGIGILIVGSILLAYGVFTRNNTYIMISIGSVIVAYLLSRYVMRLQKQSRMK